MSHAFDALKHFTEQQTSCQAIEDIEPKSGLTVRSCSQPVRWSLRGLWLTYLEVGAKILRFKRAPEFLTPTVSKPAERAGALIATVANFSYQSASGSSSKAMTAQTWTMKVDRNPSFSGVGYPFATTPSDLASHVLASFELHHVPSYRCPESAQGLPPH